MTIEEQIKKAMKQSKVESPHRQRSEDEDLLTKQVLEETVPKPMLILMAYYWVDFWGSIEERLQGAEETLFKLLSYYSDHKHEINIGKNVATSIKAKKEKRFKSAKAFFASPRVKKMLSKAVECGGIEITDSQINGCTCYRLKNWSVAQLSYFLRLLFKPSHNSKKRLPSAYIEKVFGVSRLGKYINEAYNFKIGRAWHVDINKMFEK